MNIQLFDYSVDLLASLLWQYNKAEHLQSLLTQKQLWYNDNQSQFWTDWYNDVFNLQTANNFGLSVWSIILNLPLQIEGGQDPSDKPIWGFGANGITPNSYKNFENGNFTNVGSSFALTTEEKRIVLRLRYFQLVSRTAIPEINQFLKIVFGERGNVYVLDGLNMTIRVIFRFNPGARLIYILQKFDLIPRGAGVGIRYIVDAGDIFGFGPASNGYKNFNNGCFIGEF